MGVTTWLDRITDESNLWLSAGKAEQAGDCSSAAVLYLEDACACLRRNSPVRAALSCYCAAECVSKCGASLQADRLYSQAGRLYVGIADHEVSGSIREALWALQRAYACYSLAGNSEDSRRTLESYRFLVRRANPFAAGSEWLGMPEVRPRIGRDKEGLDAELGHGVKRAIEEFSALMAPSGLKGGGWKEPRRLGGLVDDQESFVGQLG
jgi:hypothetical protein